MTIELANRYHYQYHQHLSATTGNKNVCLFRKLMNHEGDVNSKVVWFTINVPSILNLH